MLGKLKSVEYVEILLSELAIDIQVGIKSMKVSLDADFIQCRYNNIRVCNCNCNVAPFNRAKGERFCNFLKFLKGQNYKF